MLGAIAFAALAASLPACASDLREADRRPDRALTIKIIGFNDYHGTLQSPGSFGQNTAVPAAARPPVGGADAIKAWVDRLERQETR